MRRIITIALVLAAFVITAQAESNPNFIHHLQQVKSDIDCRNYQPVLAEIQRRFDRRTARDVFAAKGDYASVAAILTVKAAADQGIIDRHCLAMVYNSEVSETNMFVLVTPVGDFAIGYYAPEEPGIAGPAFTAWYDVDEDDWGFDTLAVADYTSAKTHENKVEVSITSFEASERFLTLPDSERNHQMMSLRLSCGDMRKAVNLLRLRIGNDDGEERAISYRELVEEIVETHTIDGTIPNHCVIWNDSNGIILLLSTEGDVFVGLCGRVIISWAEVKKAERLSPGNVCAYLNKGWRG